MSTQRTVVALAISALVAGLLALAIGQASAARRIATGAGSGLEAQPLISTGCAVPDVGAGDYLRTLPPSGRSYRLHVPPSYGDGSSAFPLLLNLHGLGSNALEQEIYSGLNAKADSAGFIVAAPDGTETVEQSSRHWNIILAPPETGEPDDVAFLAALLDALESEFCINRARVFSTGMSNGGQMSARLACNLSDRIVAIAPVTGTYWPPLSPDLPTEPADCPSKTRPVPVIAFHGTADAIVPFTGGLGNLGLTFRLSIEDAVAEWAANNGCASGPVDASAAPGVRLRSYSICDEGATVQLYVVEDADGDGAGTKGGGHTWPGAIDVPFLGNTTHEISANDMMWDFFLAHSPEPKPVGGVAELAEVEDTPLEAGGSTSRDHTFLVSALAAVVAGLMFLSGSAWYERRR